MQWTGDGEAIKCGINLDQLHEGPIAARNDLGPWSDHLAIVKGIQDCHLSFFDQPGLDHLGDDDIDLARQIGKARVAWHDRDPIIHLVQRRAQPQGRHQERVEFKGIDARAHFGREKRENAGPGARVNHNIVRPHDLLDRPPEAERALLVLETGIGQIGRRPTRIAYPLRLWRCTVCRAPRFSRVDGQRHHTRGLLGDLG